MQSANVRMTRPQALALIRQLPALLAGKVADQTGAVEGLQRALGMEMLSIIKQEFVVKARGGTDGAGIKWMPLSKEYIAYGRRHPGKPKNAGPRPLLTADQDKLWRQIYVRAWRRFQRDGVPEEEAKGHAAAQAWTEVKFIGGKTVLDVYGNVPVEIGRDTGRLLASLSPGPTNPDQLLRPEKGGVTVGTNVEYAQFFHAKRPLWPDEADKVPTAWTERLADVLSDGLTLLLKGLFGVR